MTFLVGERVSCVIMRNNPLINQESHCTASFHGSWFLFLQICSMARTKQTPRKGDVEEERELSKWGTAAKVAFHRPPVPPPREGSGNPSYKGMNVFNTLIYSNNLMTIQSKLYACRRHRRYVKYMYSLCMYVKT